MVAIEQANEGTEVYFVNDTSKYGGSIFIMQALISYVDGNWIKLYNGHYHKPEELRLKKRKSETMRFYL
jgi:hypothetical protein